MITLLTVEMTQEQKDKLDAWLSEQSAKNTVRSTIGDFLTYIITPTSIGMAVRVKHNGTKEEIDLTDYENW